MISKCPVCLSSDHTEIFSTRSPVYFLVTADKQPGAGGFHQLNVHLCSTCGHMFNRSFSDALAERLYGDVPLTNVPVNPSMHRRFQDLVDWIPEALFSGQEVLEIGSGSGHVARLLATVASSVIVYEPSMHLRENMLPESNIELISRTYPDAGKPVKVDFVLCRNVLEHVTDPARMMRDIRAALRPGGHAYLEVPDARYIVEHVAFPDLHLQHVQYFTRRNFLSLAAAQGLRAIDTLDIMDGHDFGVLFEAAEIEPLNDLYVEHPEAVSLGRKIFNRVKDIRTHIGRLGGQLALYGATPHGQVFLNALDGAGTFSGILDDNPRNEGFAFYDEHCTVPVRLATSDAALENDIIIITAYLHDTVIANRLRDLGFFGEILTIRPNPLAGELRAL